MTEQEYIYVRDLSNVLAAASLIRNLNVGHSVMTKEEHIEVVRILDRWQEALFNQVKIK